MTDVTGSEHSRGVPLVDELLRPSDVTLDSLVDHVRQYLVPVTSASDPARVITARPRIPEGVSELAQARRARLRGRLTDLWLVLWAVRRPVDDSLGELLDAASSSRAYQDLLDDVAQYDADTRARLFADVRAHIQTLSEVLGPRPARVEVQLGVRRRLALGISGTELRVHFDLVVTLPERRGLVDVTTSPLDPDDAPLALLALADLLAGYHPRRVAQISSATGEVRMREVDGALVDLALSTLHERTRAA